MKTSSIAAIATAFALCAGGSAALANAEVSSLSCRANHPWPPIMQQATMPPADVAAAGPVDAGTGQAAGSGPIPEGRREPGTLALVVAGLALMWFVARRRQSHDVA